MIFVIAIIGLIIFIFCNIIIKKLNLKDSTKRILTIFITIICLVCVVSIIVLLFQSKNKNSREDAISNNWIMEIERANEEEFSNKIYIYEDNTMIIEYYPRELYPEEVKKIDSNIDIDEVYKYIENSDYTGDSDYKVILNSGKGEITKYISSDSEEIKDFIEVIDNYIKVQLK